MEYITGFNTNEGVKKYDYNALSNLPEDTGWVDCEMTGVVAYGNDSSKIPKVRRIGSLVYLKGIVSPNSKTTELDPAFVIPEGFRPVGMMHPFVEQGSGSNRFCMEVAPSGSVRIYRYSNSATTSNEIPTAAWLNCFATWLVD